MPATDIKFLLRIPVELDEALRKRAEGEGWSLNQAIVGILGEAIGGNFETVKDKAGKEGKGGSQGQKVGKKGGKAGDNGQVVPVENTLTDSPRHDLIAGEKCSVPGCGAGVYEAPRKDSSGPKWKCVGARTHTMSPRGAK